MTCIRRFVLHAALIAAAAALLPGCVVAPAPMDVGLGPIYAPSAPPPPQYEVIPAAPFAGAVWIDGFWNWSSSHHVWQHGHYVRPRPGYHWQQRRWQRDPRGQWELRGGRWAR